MTHVTSTTLWKAAKYLARAQTKARILMLYTEIQCTRKGTSSMNDYLSKMKHLSE